MYFCYIAKFSCSPKRVKIAAREQHALHKVVWILPIVFIVFLKHLGEFSVVALSV